MLVTEQLCTPPQVHPSSQRPCSSSCSSQPRQWVYYLLNEALFYTYLLVCCHTLAIWWWYSHHILKLWLLWHMKWQLSWFGVVLQLITFLTGLTTCPLEKRSLGLSAPWTAQRKSLLIVRLSSNTNLFLSQFMLWCSLFHSRIFNNSLQLTTCFSISSPLCQPSWIHTRSLLTHISTQSLSG